MTSALQGLHVVLMLAAGLGGLLALVVIISGAVLVMRHIVRWRRRGAP
ncbi:hypothetical protein QA640_36225 [Bradyrhizobium sp. CB82]|nr:hypothetical protein [Bradyrhizobium sp. CB82]WFU39742.1 hypothetical protein QA640_36225 [Bradyrhizobium sp. CB82]